MVVPESLAFTCSRALWLIVIHTRAAMLCECFFLLPVSLKSGKMEEKGTFWWNKRTYRDRGLCDGNGKAGILRSCPINDLSSGFRRANEGDGANHSLHGCTFFKIPLEQTTDRPCQTQMSVVSWGERREGRVS